MKRSFRDYLITLLLAIVVFSVVAVFLIQAGQGLMSDVISKLGSSESTVMDPNSQGGNPAEQTPDPENPEVKKDKAATFLLIGLDYNNKNADAIFLVGINATKKQATVALIPSDTEITEGTNKYNLGSLYGSRGINFFKSAIQEETGVLADYYAAMPMSALTNLIDILGGIKYKVPCTMYHYDPYQNLRINLAAGEQTLNGDQALQMLCYRGYSDGITGREDTQLGFVRSFCLSFMSPSNLSRAKAILNNMYYNCETDFSEASFKELGEMMFNLSSYAPTFTRIPGARGSSRYAINSSRAQSMFEIYQ